MPRSADRCLYPPTGDLYVVGPYLEANHEPSVPQGGLRSRAGAHKRIQTTSPGLLHAFDDSINDRKGKLSGWGVRSLELRFVPDVTLGNSHTSVGFLPRGLHFSLPFFF